MAEYIEGENECIHLIYPHENGKITTTPTRIFAGSPGEVPVAGGTFDIACTPGSKLPKHASCLTVAVTCPLCRGSKVFQELDSEQNSPANNLGPSDADQRVRQHLAAQPKGT